MKTIIVLMALNIWTNEHKEISVFTDMAACQQIAHSISEQAKRTNKPGRAYCTIKKVQDNKQALDQLRLGACLLNPRTCPGVHNHYHR